MPACTYIHQKIEQIEKMVSTKEECEATPLPSMIAADDGIFGGEGRQQGEERRCRSGNGVVPPSLASQSSALLKIACALVAPPLMACDCPTTPSDLMLR